MKTGTKVALVVGGVAVGGLVAAGVYEEMKKPTAATQIVPGHRYQLNLQCPSVSQLPTGVVAGQPLGTVPGTVVSVSTGGNGGAMAIVFDYTGPTTNTAGIIAEINGQGCSGVIMDLGLTSKASTEVPVLPNL
jgi:hypothetical protein